MPKLTRALLFLTLAITFAPVAIAQSSAEKAFSAIKSMPGNWEQKGPDGHVLQVMFKTVSGGSAVMSEIQAHGTDMISVFNLDGPNKLLLTHYCTVGNQPRMQAAISPDGKTITFNYVDATNLSAPDAGHMEKMVLTLLDDNHHTEEWTFLDHGKEMREVFDLRRKM
jgi:hypothetical protein